MTITDVEARLRNDLPRLADAIVSEAPTAGVAVLPTRTRRSRRPALVAVVAACVVIALVVAALVFVARDHHNVTPRPATREFVLTEPGWHALSPSGLGPRGGIIPLWTGKDVVVSGGYRLGGLGALVLDGGAMYEPQTDSWRELTRLAAHPGAFSVWAGGRVVWFAKQGGGSFDPYTGESQSFPLLRAGISIFQAAVSTGPQAFAVLGTSNAIQIVRFDQPTKSWILGAVRDVDLPTAQGIAAVWTGDEVIVWNGATRGWAYSPATDTWRDLPSLPLDNPSNLVSSVAWVDQRLIVAYAVDGTSGRDLVLGTLVDDQWSLDTPLVGTGFERPQAVTDGGRLAVVDDEGVGIPLVFDTLGGPAVKAAGYPLRPGSGTAAVWTPGGLFVWGGLPKDTPSTFDNPSPNQPESAFYTTGSAAPNEVPTPVPPSDLAPAMPASIIAARGDAIVELDSASGSQTRTVGTESGATWRSVVVVNAKSAIVDDGRNPTGCDGGPTARGLVQFDLASGAHTNVPAEADVRGSSGIAVAPDASVVAYLEGSCSVSNDATHTLAVRSLTDGSTRRFHLPARSEGARSDIISIGGWSADSRHLVIGVQREPRYEWWLIDTDQDPNEQLAGQIVPIHDDDPPGGYDLAPLGTTDQWITPAPAQDPSVYTRVVEFDLATGRPGQALFTWQSMPEHARIRVVDSDASGNNLLLIVTTPGRASSLYRWSRGDQSPVKVADNVSDAAWAQS